MQTPFKSVAKMLLFKLLSTPFFEQPRDNKDEVDDLTKLRIPFLFASLKYWVKVDSTIALHK